MSSFSCPVVKIGITWSNPNAESLSVTNVFDYTVQFRNGEYKEGDLAVYIPLDAVLPLGDTRWSFLNGKNVVKAKKLRGIISMGMLTKIPEGENWQEGHDAKDYFGIVKYVNPILEAKGGNNERDPGFIPVYTDIESIRNDKFKDVLIHREEVVLTEKIRGENGRFVYSRDRLWAGSRTCIKAPGHTHWWGVAERLNLEERLKNFPDMVIYGEVYGKTGGFPYDAVSEQRNLLLFDIFSIKQGKYLDYDDFICLSKEIGLRTVPELYRGPWSEDLKSLADGNSLVAKTVNRNHIKEGFVVRPIKERFDERVGRVILKRHGDEFLLKDK